MNPVVTIEQGNTYNITIPMADIDGDQLRCRWGVNENEAGGIYESKGQLESNPCVLIYQATAFGYEGIAVIIEDFDTNGEVLSSIPLQFLIKINPYISTTTTTTITTTTETTSSTTTDGSGSSPNSTDVSIDTISTILTTTTTVTPTTTTTTLPVCSRPPIYVGDRESGACIGVPLNSTIELKIVVEVPCENSCTTIHDILTISPTGMQRSAITQDTHFSNRYNMYLQWTPQPYQYGIHQVCVTPVDNSNRFGSTVCFTLLVDVHSPQFVNGSMSPTGIVPQNQSTWTIATDVDIVPPAQPDTAVVFFKRNSSGVGDDVEVARVHMSTAEYQSRQITFNTGNIIWDEVSQLPNLTT